MSFYIVSLYVATFTNTTQMLNEAILHISATVAVIKCYLQTSVVLNQHRGQGITF